LALIDWVGGPASPGEPCRENNMDPVKNVSKFSLVAVCYLFSL